ncbi:MAG TPA: MOSC and FAD-binding oxidoreductase domain-containing protein [Candidatus Limnocylindrales bacterium]|nr:MOSC and FAD-binding oxidoreductase domain-containing protein [Candidatus Limnocylindrales bacterium]
MLLFTRIVGGTLAARLVSVNVGLPRDIAWRGKTVHTGIWKSPVAGRVKVRRLNINGDGQGDLGGHGGLNRAVMVYQMDSYRYWERALGRNNLALGQFGENFTLEGLPDAEVCIGDRFRIGSALFEISQPRVTCYRVGIRMDDPQMPSRLVAHHRPGFYFRVLEEGEVGAGDEIIKIAEGPEHMSVAQIDSLLYLGAHTREQLERALRIPALSEGWKSSFQDLLRQESEGPGTTGNAGLSPSPNMPPGWPGFRRLRVARIERESDSVKSLTLEPADDRPLVAALPGQFVVLQLHPTADRPAVLRNYSLSDLPVTDHYRVSVKREENGLASTYLHTQMKVGDLVDVAAPRGNFTLLPGDNPVVLISVGVGVTPVLAMLHALAEEASPREVWWLFGARNRYEHPFAEESRALVRRLPRGKLQIWYSRPSPQDRLGVDFDLPGRIAGDAIKKLEVPRDANFYLCGPNMFLSEITSVLAAMGISRERVHAEIFGAGTAITPGIAESSPVRPHPPEGSTGVGPQVSFARSGLNVCWDPKFSSLLEFAEACDVPVRWSCRTGVCHMCESGLISGRVAYQPEPLDPPARGNLLICCSQPQGNVVIDL